MEVQNVMKQSNISRFAIHYEKSSAIWQLSDFLLEYLPLHEQNLTFCCIGTDRSTGDSLGPLVGSYLQSMHSFPFRVIGTLEQPLHALNLEEKVAELKTEQPFVVAIDACLGDEPSVGLIVTTNTAIQPGKAVNKQLPPIGDFAIKGVVNVGGFMEAAVLQNTRLHVTQSMSAIIAKAILMTWQRYLLNEKHHSNNDTNNHNAWKQIGYTNFR